MIPFISREDLGFYLRQDLSTSDMATIALDAACQTVRDYLQQEVNFEDADGVTLNGTGTNVFLLPELPIVELIQVSTFDLDGEETVLDASDYRLGSCGDVWRVGDVWPRGISNIGVVYSHGYDIDPTASGQGSGEESAPDMPSSIRLVALQVASRVFVAGTVSVGGLASENIGQYSYTLGSTTAGSELTPGEMSVLNRYRIRRGVA